ncbi:13560_t:CDS:2, partial [Cetraspora pellucida]
TLGIEDPGMGDRVRAYADHSHPKTHAGLVPKDIKSPNLYQDLNPDKSV